MEIKKEVNNEHKNIKEKVDLFSNKIDQYIMEEKLGEGIFGTVKLATHKITKGKVAIKILNKNKITKNQQTLLTRELSILRKMNHFNIIKLYSIIETETIIYLIQEYSEGKELSNYIQNHSKLDEKEACKFFQQIISGIEYIHKMGIAHRDLKPENILLTRANDIKIIDFGLSNIYSEGQMLKTSCGSPYYAPPEMLQGKPYKGLYSDIYTCGIILYYMLSKKLPFNENNNQELYKKIIAGEFNMPKNISKEAQDLLKKIIKVNPEERIKINDMKKHPWFKLANISYNMHSGLNCDEIVFPIDNDIVQSMVEIGFNKMEVRYNIIKNEHNNITTTYYLLLDKKIKKGRKSIADLHSNLFDNYIKDPKNKIENYKEGIEEAIKERINSKGIIKTIPDFELDRKRKKSIISTRRRSSVKNSIRNSINAKENNELNDKIKMKIKMNIMNKKEKEKKNFPSKTFRNINDKNINKNRKIFSAKINKKNNEIKKNEEKAVKKKLFENLDEKNNNRENNNIKDEKKEDEQKIEEKEDKKDNTNINDNLNKNENIEKLEEININNNIINNHEINNNNDKNIENNEPNELAHPIEDNKKEINTPLKINEEKKIPKKKNILNNKNNSAKNIPKLNNKQKKEVKTEQKNNSLRMKIMKEVKENILKNKALKTSVKKKNLKKFQNKNSSALNLPVKKNLKNIKK